MALHQQTAPSNVGDTAIALATDRPTALITSRTPARPPSTGRVTKVGLTAYVITRVLLLATSRIIAAVDHLAWSAVLRPWDARWYLAIADRGYRSSSAPHRARSDAFFPLYPLLTKVLHRITPLSLESAAIVLSWVGGALLVSFGARLASSLWEYERAVQAAVLLAVFPGSVVAGLPYADPLGLAFAAASLLELRRRRFLTAGLAAGLATATFSLVVVPLLAIALWTVVVQRQPRATLTLVLCLTGIAGYFSFLWMHTGSPLIWFRVESIDWHSHVGVSLRRGMFWIFHVTVESSIVAAVCCLGLIAGFVALLKLRAPSEWVIFCLVVLATILFDTGTWLTPRMIYAMFPCVLALGAFLSRRWIIPLVILFAGLLCLCLVIYTPQNYVFFNP